MTSPVAKNCLLFLWLLLYVAHADTMRADVTVSPTRVELHRPEASQQLLVSDQSASGRTTDQTRLAEYEIVDTTVASIDSDGLIRPVRNGNTELIVQQSGTILRVPINVAGVDNPDPVSFQHEIMPILTKAGCNSGGCHGKADGQNGFKLSVFGYDAEFDFNSLINHGRGRRVFPASPDQSLILLKASAQVPHSGGRKIDRHSHRYRLLRRWIAEGAPYSAKSGSQVLQIQVQPEQIALAASQSQQLQVTATRANGTQFCVTAETTFGSNTETIATVDERGLITAGEIPGEAAMVVSYMGNVGICRVTVPREGVDFERPPENNFVDRHGWDKLQKLGILPAVPADDSMFMRRVFIDTIGTLPTAEESRHFIISSDTDKRSQLIDDLLERPEYADYWALLWADILRVDQGIVQPQGAVAMTRWLHDQLAANRPYDEFVGDILTARGNTTTVGPAAFYHAVKEPDELSRSISQLFLGVRIECAQCHHHPSERWGQEDYFAFAGFFTGLKQKTLPSGAMSIVPVPGSDAVHPLSGEPIATAALGAEPANFIGQRDRRKVLAKWLTSGDNPYFSKMIVNRIWAHYFGRGLVEPVDDLRATNPASNEPLINALESHLHELDFDLKAFTKTLLNSRLYQLSSETNDSNVDDLQNFSHAIYKPLKAEVLLDAINQVAGTTEKFNGWPTDYRAIEIWDNRMPSYFFRIFGRPLRASVCQCERGDDPSIAQALHLMNSMEVTQKIASASGKARKIADSEMSDDKIIETLYLVSLNRFPTRDERHVLRKAFENRTLNRSQRRTAVEDILWTLLNTREFMYNH